ncbi:hypothetical protein JCM10213_004843 [Rhodosporidiobolus nylandii]
MGGGVDATAYLDFGVNVFAMSLYCARVAFFTGYDAVRAIRLIQKRKSNGTLRVVGEQSGAVARVPEETWDQIVDIIKSRACAAETLKSTMCENCVVKYKEDGREPEAWHEYPPFQPRPYYDTPEVCGDCQYEGRKWMVEVFNCNIRPFLHYHGLDVDWHRWPEYGDDEAYLEDLREDESIPDAEPRAPLTVVLLRPLYRREARPYFPSISGGGSCYPGVQEETSRMFDLQPEVDLCNAPEILKTIERFFRRFAIPLVEPKREGRPGFVMRMTVTGYE